MPRVVVVRVAALVACTVLVAAGCIAPPGVPLYNLWVVNRGAEDRVIVLGSDLEGSSTNPALLIPADGFTRSTQGATLGSAGATAAILIYDLSCTLIGRAEVGVGSFLITLNGDQAVLGELTRAGEPTGAPFAPVAPTDCAAVTPP